MSSTASERITTRMNKETKELLERAMLLSGYSSLNSFIIHAAAAEAKKLIEQEMTIQLTKEEAVHFLQTLETPRDLSNRFQKAAQKHKEIVNGKLSITE